MRELYFQYDENGAFVAPAQYFNEHPGEGWTTTPLTLENSISPRYDAETDEWYEGADSSEVIAKLTTTAIDAEYQRYLQRKADGENAYLMISAELRMAKLGGEISDAVHKIIEHELEPVRAEVVLGQWIGGLQKLEVVGATIIGATMYNDLHSRISTYIAANY